MHKTAWLFMIAAGLFLSGCSTFNTRGAYSNEEVFDYEGMPDEKYLVGGGYFISYRAMEEGELFLVDTASERLLATVSLQPGEDHQMVYDITDEKLAANLESLGIDPKKAKFKLYFVPRR